MTEESMTEEIKQVSKTAALLVKPGAPYPLPTADFRPSQAIKQNRRSLQLHRRIARLLN
jgi:hypothetical protein